MTQLQFSIVTHEEPPWTVVVVSGEIDLATAPHLQSAIDGANGPVAIDLSDVAFMDSSGLRSLINANVDVDAAGDESEDTNGTARVSHRMILLNPSAPVLRLLEVAGLESVFKIHDTVPLDGDPDADGS